jgi:hypothetical protein
MFVLSTLRIIGPTQCLYKHVCESGLDNSFCTPRNSSPSRLHILLALITERLKVSCNSLHGAESFLRSRQSPSYSRVSQHFMEPDSSLPCSQEPSTSLYSELDESTSYTPLHPISLKSIAISSSLVRLSS